MNLTNNNLCDLEKTALLLVKLKKLKILNLRINPICLVTNYQNTVFEELLNLEHFDGEDIQELKKREEKKKQQAKDKLNLS